LAIHYTSNLQLPYPDGAEAVSGGPADFQGIVSVLDAGAAGPTATRVTVGSLAARPAATTVPVGSLYHASDVQALAYSDGSQWHPVAFNTMGPPVGAMQQYAGISDPADPDGTVRWMICNGRALSRTGYAQLFNVIGTTFGAGDGSTTFNIPNASFLPPTQNSPVAISMLIRVL